MIRRAVASPSYAEPSKYPWPSDAVYFQGLAMLAWTHDGPGARGLRLRLVTIRDLGRLPLLVLAAGDVNEALADDPGGGTLV